MPQSLAIDFQTGTEPQARASDPDRHAVALALADPEAFAVLYRRYAVDIFRYCARRTDDREAAEDLTSHIFMKALSTLPSLGDRPFRPWLFTIAHNLAIDAWRARKPTVSLDGLADRVDRDASPEQLALQREAASEIHALLRTLPERERQVVELRLGELTGKEIADVLGCSHAAVRMAHHRAIEHLRIALANESPGNRSTQ
jgi:RNA polymerase sigma-70 factor (ECF subfamily)